MNQNHPLMQQLVCSPCCIHTLTYHELLQEYSKMGFTKMEGFANRPDWHEDPIIAREAAQAVGIAITSYHLPAIEAKDIEAGLSNALAAARYAEKIGAKVMLFKASDRDVFEQVGKRFLDALDEQQINVTPAVQNHRGTAISTIEDYADVFARLDHDPRLKAVLEVGHFHRVGVSWQQGWDYLSDRIALIHINDIREGDSVQYGTGEVDFAGLFQRIKDSGYCGEIVVELELESRRTDPRETLESLPRAIDTLLEIYSKV